MGREKRTRRWSVLVCAAVASVPLWGWVPSSRGSDQSVTGAPGASGGPGAAGGAGSMALLSFLSADAFNTGSAYGGAGGEGGAGVEPDGAGGAGGAGGGASSQVFSANSVAPYITAYAYAVAAGGGHGGAGTGTGANGTHGAAGAADARSRAESTLAGATVDSYAQSQGGSNTGAVFGNGVAGGSASSEAVALGPVGGLTRASAYAVGGYGQSAFSGFQPVGTGGVGGAATATATASPAAGTPAGARNYEVVGTAFGGNGGVGSGVGSSGGAGGPATVGTLSYPSALADAVVTLSLRQQQGFGGDGYAGAAGGNGPSSSVNRSYAFAGTYFTAYHEVTGGSGGNTFRDEFGASGAAGFAGQGTQTVSVSAPAADVAVNLISFGGAGGTRYGAGDGRAGGAASTAVSVSQAARLLSTQGAVAVGGRGGNGGAVTTDNTGAEVISAGNGGAGGTGTAGASSLVANSASYFYITAYGGEGGGAVGAGRTGGAGGAAVVSVSSLTTSASGAAPVLSASAIGGAGGGGVRGANGGAGRSVSMTNLVSGNSGFGGGPLTLGQNAFGGAGGSSEDGVPGAGGTAFSSLDRTNPGGGGLSVGATATGGDGGIGYGATAGRDGATGETRSIATSSGPASAYGYPSGGRGGDSYGAAPAGHGASPAASSSVFAHSLGADATAGLYMYGGSGGSAQDSGAGGNGGAAVAVDAADAVGVTVVYITQEATGGGGGSAFSGTLGVPGPASSTLTRSITAPQDLNLYTVARGGDAGIYGNTDAGNSRAGASGTAGSDGTSTASSVYGSAYALGGRGSGSGIEGGQGGPAQSLARATAGGDGETAYANANAQGGAGWYANQALVDHRHGGGGPATSEAVSVGGALTAASYATSSAFGGSGFTGFGSESRAAGRSPSGGGGSSGGSDVALAGPGGAGGPASAVATAVGSLSAVADTRAYGGGGAAGLQAGRGGDATASSTVSPAVTGTFNGYAEANGGGTPAGGRPGRATATARNTVATSTPGALSATAYSNRPLLGAYAFARADVKDAAANVKAVAAVEETTPLPIAVLAGSAAGVYAQANVLAADAAAFYSTSPALQSTFGDGTGTIAVGHVRLAAASATGVSEARFSLSGDSLRAFEGLPIFVGLFGVTGTGTGGVYVEYTRDSTVVTSASVPLSSATVALDGSMTAVTDAPAYPTAGGLGVYVRLASEAAADLQFSYVVATPAIPNQWRGGLQLPDWGDAANWTGSLVPDGANAVAVINQRFTEASTLLLPVVRTVGRLDVMADVSYREWRLAGAGGLKLESTVPGVDATVAVRDATLVLNVPLELVSDTAINVGVDSTVRINAGTTGAGALTVDGAGRVVIDGAAAEHARTFVYGGTLEVGASGSLVAAVPVRVDSLGDGTASPYYGVGLFLAGNQVLDSVVGVGATTVAGGATLELTANPPPLGSPFTIKAIEQRRLYLDYYATVRVTSRSTDVSTGVRVADPVVLDVGSLSIVGGGGVPGTNVYYGLVDVGDSILIARDASLAEVTDMVRYYRDSGGAGGVGSSFASAEGFTTVGVFANATGPGGAVAYYEAVVDVPLGAGDVLVAYAYIGDTDLDGVVDGRDLVNLIEGLTTGATGWQHGDLNYDGVVNGVDLTLLKASLAAKLPALGGPGGAAGGGGSVPEPGAAGLAAAGGVWLGRRRRRGDR